MLMAPTRSCRTNYYNDELQCVACAEGTFTDATGRGCIAASTCAAPAPGPDVASSPLDIRSLVGDARAGTTDAQGRGGARAVKPRRAGKRGRVARSL